VEIEFEDDIVELKKLEKQANEIAIRIKKFYTKICPHPNKIARGDSAAEGWCVLCNKFID
jgi:hypothetical protein